MPSQAAVTADQVGHMGPSQARARSRRGLVLDAYLIEDAGQFQAPIERRPRGPVVLAVTLLPDDVAARSHRSRPRAAEQRVTPEALGTGFYGSPREATPIPACHAATKVSRSAAKVSR